MFSEPRGQEGGFGGEGLEKDSLIFPQDILEAPTSPVSFHSRVNYLMTPWR